MFCFRFWPVHTADHLRALATPEASLNSNEGRPRCPIVVHLKRQARSI